MVFRWCAEDGPTLNAGLVALRFYRGSGPVLLENPIFLWFFRGYWTPCPPLWIRAWDGTDRALIIISTILFLGRYGTCHNQLWQTIMSAKRSLRMSISLAFLEKNNILSYLHARMESDWIDRIRLYILHINPQLFACCRAWEIYHSRVSQSDYLGQVKKLIVPNVKF